MGAIGGIIGGVGSLVGGLSASSAANSAARAQERGIQRQIQFQTDAFNATNRLMAPSRQIGFGAQDMLSRMFLGTGSPLAQSGFATGTPSADIPNLIGGGTQSAQASQATQSGGRTLNAFGQQRLREILDVDPGTPRAQAIRQLPPEAFDNAPVTTTAATEAGDTVEGEVFEPGQETFDFSGFYESPGFTFRQEEGNKALQNRLSAMGLSESGRGTKDFIRFNQGLASEEFNNFTNQLFNLAGFGQTANANTANALLSTGNNVGQAFANQGTVRASGIVGGANAFSGALQGLPGSIASGVKFGQELENLFNGGGGSLFGGGSTAAPSAAAMQQFAAGSAVGAF